ncbi:CPBP family intramembrane glutamic endopeptidase [Kocuria sp. ZOR0020]|uniref:CPBP family intramembrane glutamic endopeptidase n=1 Tax=Kocuria sp. ZOR0020 TaxID=1339234 RepID=UPI0009DCE1AB|nr:CPBP family intramembrane glutamic endopeptidase [Kocuria sp. ZOR0020]
MISTGSLTTGAQPRSWADAQRRKAHVKTLAPNPSLRDVLYAGVLVLVTDLGATLGVILGGLAFGATGATTTGVVASVGIAAVGLALDVMSLRPGAGPLSQIRPETAQGLMLALVPSLVMALVQEVLFRRVLLDWLLQHLPIPAAATITVVVFAAVHLDAASILFSLILGVALTASRLWYGNLWAPVIMS